MAVLTITNASLTVGVIGEREGVKRRRGHHSAAQDARNEGVGQARDLVAWDSHGDTNEAAPAAEAGLVEFGSGCW